LGAPERKVMLKKYWKQEPPINDEQHTKLVIHGNHGRLFHWCKCHKPWTIQSPKECRKQCSERKKFKRNTGKLRSKLTEPHSNPRTEQNEFKARDEAHTPHKAKEVKVKRKWRYSNASREIQMINP
jgi:hypothetical protein